MRLCLAALLLVATSALAQTSDPAPNATPQGHFFVGLSVAAVQPFGDSLDRRQSMSTGVGFGLDAHYEATAFLINAEIEHGSFANDDTYSNPLAISLRAGPIFGRGKFAPYVSAGFSLLGYGAIGDDAASAYGASFEAGLLMFRDRPLGRITPFIEYFLPLSAQGGKGSQYVTQLSWAAAGVRFQF